MPDHRPQITVVLGSATPPGRLHRAIADAAGRASDAAAVTTIDLAEVVIGPADARPLAERGDDAARVVDAIASAGAVVLATPVYRGSLTGVLKNLLDLVPVAALRDTPVAIVAMGASQHHHLGVERHLRDVLAFFGAVPLPTAVYLVSADFADGVPSEAAAGMLDDAFSSLARLAVALRRAGPLGPAPLAARWG